MIVLIACVGKNLAIGKNNDMPWGRSIPEDLAYFKKMTNGSKVIMGRKTFESILESLGKPLPNRQHIILTRDKNFVHEDTSVVYSVEEFLAQHDQQEQVFVIGGANTYEQFVEVADVLLLTEIHQDFEADRFFPKFDKNVWREVKRLPGSTDQHTAYEYDFVTYLRNS